MHDWGYFAEPEDVVGGSSSINAPVMMIAEKAADLSAEGSRLLRRRNNYVPGTEFASAAFILW